MAAGQERALVALARTQRGHLTSADLHRITGRPDELRRRVRSGLWQEVVPGVVVSASIAVTDEVRESACMLWEPRSLLSHYNAARRNGIWAPDTDRVWLSTEFLSKRRSRAGIEVMRTRHLPQRFKSDGFHRWTPPARTVVDLAMCLTRRQLEATLLSAIRATGITAADVDTAAAELPGRAGLQLLREVTGLWTPERESLLEDELFGDVSAAVGSGVTRQHQIHDRSGRVAARIDVAVAQLRLAFEADGLLFHSTDLQLANDQKRDRFLLGRGWQTVRFREGALENRAGVRAEIRAIVDRRRRDLGAASA